MNFDSAIMTPMRTIAGKEATRAMSEVIAKLFEYSDSEPEAGAKIELEDAAIILMRVNELVYYANTKLHELGDEPLKFSQCDEANHRTLMQCREKRIASMGLPKEKY